MKKVLGGIVSVVFVIVIAFFQFPALRDTFFYKAPPNVKYTEAIKHIDEEIVTKGTVEKTGAIEGDYVMLIGENSTKGVLVIIPKDYKDDIETPEIGDTVEVRGQVFEDKGDGKTVMAGIEVNDKEQINIIK